MDLDREFASLEIVSMQHRRRLSGAHSQMVPIVNAQGDCSSNSISSIDEMDEHNNENYAAQNNSVSENHTNEAISLRRSGRKRIRTTTFTSSFSSGRCSNSSSKFAKLATITTLQPLSLDTLGETDIASDSIDYLKQIYLDKTIKLKHNALETIFEEPRVASTGKGKTMIMSGRKFRRFISFDDTVSNITKKTKKRSMKAKINASKTRSRSKFNIKQSSLIL